MKDNKPIAVTNVIVSPQHAPNLTREAIIAYVTGSLAPRVLGDWFTKKIRFHVNPTGSFIHGGPSADAGVTGRKIIVDTYGGSVDTAEAHSAARTPPKWTAAGRISCRYIARQLVKTETGEQGGNPDFLRHRRGASSVGQSGYVRNRGCQVAAEFVKTGFPSGGDYRAFQDAPPHYRQTTNYGHFGKPGLPWEE